MTPEDRRKAIEHIVNDRYSTQLSNYLVQFLTQYSQHVQEQVAWSRVMGRPIYVEPVRLDLRPLHTQLINDLVAFEIILGKDTNVPSYKETDNQNV